MVCASSSSWLPAVPAEAVDWDATYREEMPRVFNYFRYRGFERATAEDLTSATFEKAWRARDRYRRDRAGVATWLLAIARNVAIDHFRRSAAGGADRGRGAPRRRDAGDRGAARGGVAAACGRSSRGSPERERELLALKYGAGATNRDIATITGLGESNVGTILHRTIVRPARPVERRRSTVSDDFLSRLREEPRPSSRNGSSGACARSTRASASGASRRAPGGASPPRSRACPSRPRSPLPSRSSRCGPRPASSSISSG